MTTKRMWTLVADVTPKKVAKLDITLISRVVNAKPTTNDLAILRELVGTRKMPHFSFRKEIQKLKIALRDGHWNSRFQKRFGFCFQSMLEWRHYNEILQILLAMSANAGHFTCTTTMTVSATPATAKAYKRDNIEVTISAFGPFDSRLGGLAPDVSHIADFSDAID